MTSKYVWLSIIAISGILLTSSFTMSSTAFADKDGKKDKGSPLEIISNKITYATDEDGTILKAEISTEGKISKNGKSGAFGYGLLTAGGNNVLALTTHVCASDSPYQGNAGNGKCPNPVGLGTPHGVDPPFTDAFVKSHDGAKFHAHVLDLMPTTAACTTAIASAGLTDLGLEVDIVSSATTNGGLAGVSPDYPIKAHGNTIRVGNVPVDVLGDPNTIPTVVSFGIVGVADTNGDITNLCLTSDI